MKNLFVFISGMGFGFAAGALFYSKEGKEIRNKLQHDYEAKKDEWNALFNEKMKIWEAKYNSQVEQLADKSIDGINKARVTAKIHPDNLESEGQ